MLGHDDPQSDPENALRVAVSVNSDAALVAEALSIYCTRYQSVPRLYRVFRGPALLKFLTLFGGVTIQVPSGDDPDSVRLSHLPDLAEHFGEELLGLFVEEFLGESVRVPPTDYIVSSVRDVDIFRSLQAITNTDQRRATIRRLSSYYRMKPVDIQLAFRRVKDTMHDLTAAPVEAVEEAAP